MQINYQAVKLKLKISKSKYFLCLENYSVKELKIKKKICFGLVFLCRNFI